MLRSLAAIEADLDNQLQCELRARLLSVQQQVEHPFRIDNRNRVMIIRRCQDLAANRA